MPYVISRFLILVLIHSRRTHCAEIISSRHLRHPASGGVVPPDRFGNHLAGKRLGRCPVVLGAGRKACVRYGARRVRMGRSGILTSRREAFPTCRWPADCMIFSLSSQFRDQESRPQTRRASATGRAILPPLPYALGRRSDKTRSVAWQDGCRRAEPPAASPRTSTAFLEATSQKILEPTTHLEAPSGYAVRFNPRNLPLFVTCRPVCHIAFGSLLSRRIHSRPRDLGVCGRPVFMMRQACRRPVLQFGCRSRAVRAAPAFSPCVCPTTDSLPHGGLRSFPPGISPQVDVPVLQNSACGCWMRLCVAFSSSAVAACQPLERWAAAYPICFPASLFTVLFADR